MGVKNIYPKELKLGFYRNHQLRTNTGITCVSFFVTTRTSLKEEVIPIRGISWQEFGINEFFSPINHTKRIQ